MKKFLLILIFLITNSHLNAQTQGKEAVNCKNSCEIYLLENPDVARAKLDAWYHYNRFGKNEGRRWPSCKESLKDAKNNNIYKPKSIPLTLTQFKEALNLYFQAYKTAIIIESNVFDPMKLVIERGCSYYPLKGKYLMQYNIMTGVAKGGPSSYGDDKEWRLAVGLLGDNPRFNIDYQLAVSQFTNSMNSQSAPECKECQKVITKYTDYFLTNTKWTNTEFLELKNKVQLCKNQRFNQLSTKFKNKLLKMSGGDGGPTSYGDDRDWMLITQLGQRKQVIYEQRLKFSNGDFLVKHNDKLGITDGAGYLFIETNYRYIEEYKFANANYYKVKLDNRFGVINTDGGILLSTNYERILDSELSDSVLIAKFEGVWGSIKSPYDNFSVIKADNIISEGPFKIIVLGDKQGLLNRNGSISLSPKYDRISSIRGTSLESDSYLLKVKIGSKYGLLDRGFNEVLPLEYDQIDYDPFVQDDRRGTSYGLTYNVGYIPIFMGDKMGYFDIDSKKIKFEPIYDDIKGLGVRNYGLEVVSIAKLNGKFGLLSNNTGKPITPFKYDNVSPFVFDNLSASVKIKNKSGLLSIDGIEVISCSYDSIADFGIKYVSTLYKNGKLGIANWSNKNSPKIIEPRFEGFSRIDSNIIMSRIGYQYGLISIEMEELITPKFDGITKMRLGGYSVRLSNKWGFANSIGNLVVYPIYDSQFEFINNIAEVTLNGTSFEINESGSRFKSFITIDDLDIYYKDISVSNYYGALENCKALGKGWRLPTFEELKLINKNIDVIGNLTTEFNRYNVNSEYNIIQSVDATNYWGEGGRSIILRKAAVGYGRISDAASENGKTTWFYSVRPVRINPEIEKQKKESQDALARNVLSQISFSDIFEYSNSGENNSSSSRKSNSSKTKTECSNCNRKFKFKIWRGGQHDSGNCWGGWENEEKTSPGYVKCSDCSGYGLNWSYDGKCPVSKKCYVHNCSGGWIKCNKCYGKGK